MTRRRWKDAALSPAGSVSIYFIAATAAIMLLCALLIDFSRIAAFRYTAMTAVQSGVRSVLSSYDPDFYAQYGLFIRGGEDADGLLRIVLDEHAADSGADADESFPYLDIGWSDAGVTESRPLADHGVFRRQVLEEMKYKAPVDLTLELAAKFRGVKPAMQEAAATVDILERMRKAYDHREAAFDDALAEQNRSGEQAMDRLRSLAPYPPASMSGGLPAGAASHAVDAALRYDGYMAARQVLAHADENTPVMLLQQVSLAISAYESSTAALSSKLSGAASRIAADAENSRAKAGEALRKAKEANEEMRRIAAEAESVSTASGHAHGAASETDSEMSVDPQKVNGLGEIRRMAGELVLEETFFDRYAAELETQRERADRLSKQSTDAATDLSGLRSGSTDYGTRLRASADSLQRTLADYASAYGAGGSVLQERRALLQSHRAHDGERKALEQQADAEWSNWRKEMGSLGGHPGSGEEQQSFREADRLARENLAWNREQEQLPEGRAEPGDASAGRDSALESTNSSLQALEEAGLGLRDSMYLSEYAFARLSRFPPDQAKRLLAGEAVPLGLERQEMEYVMYGLTQPYGNIAAAYGELFAFRLAIRTMEGLIECRGMGHPLLILAAALVYGLRNAVQDIRLLMDRDSVPLSKYLQVETTYADYLRLFFVLHGDSPVRLSRFIAVMERTTGLSLSQAYTYASAEATASLRLWFFPGLQKFLGRFAQLGGTVKGNRYEAVYTADSAYQ